MATRVMQYESGGRSEAHNYNDTTMDDSFGCFQVNRYGSLAKTRPLAPWLLNPNNNVQYALALYKSEGWRPWANTIRKLGIK